MGWIFPISKKDSVEEYINEFKKTGEIKQIQGTTQNFQKTDLSDILKRLERLEMEVKQLRMEKEKKAENDKQSEDENGEKNPRRRLLKKM